MQQLWTQMVEQIRSRWQQLRATGDAGYSTETVVVTAALVILALAVLAIIAAKIIAKAKAIDLG
jgi:hypothetical protein